MALVILFSICICSILKPSTLWIYKLWHLWWRRFLVARITYANICIPSTFRYGSPILRTEITNGLPTRSAVMSSSIANIRGWSNHFIWSTGFVKQFRLSWIWILFLGKWYELFGSSKCFCTNTAKICFTILIWHPVWRPRWILYQICKK